MAREDKFYFQHDYHARNDPKIASLILDFKSAGYGIYWMIAEMMHEQGGSLQYDDHTLASIAKDSMESLKLVTNVINNCIKKYKLFKLKNKKLTADRVEQNLARRKEVSDVRAAAGRASGEARKKAANGKKKGNKNEQTGTNVQQVFNKREQKGTKERKGKEIKALQLGNNTLHTTTFFCNAGNAEKKDEIKKCVTDLWKQHGLPESFQVEPEFEKLFKKVSDKEIANPKKYILAWLENFNPAYNHQSEINGKQKSRSSNAAVQGQELYAERLGARREA